jgi:DNA-binding transcriptional LysR family regulator
MWVQFRVVFSADNRANRQPLVFKWKQSMSEMDDLAAFAVLVEAGSFTLAAQQLGCSKGQLSKRISQLETQFSVVLLQRTTRRLSLTAAGAALLPQAQALVIQVERARQALARLKDDIAGPVRMTVPVSLGETFFDGLLLEFSAKYPEVQIELELNNSYRELARDGFDLAIRSDVAIDQRLVARPLLAWHEMTCASPAYL